MDQAIKLVQILAAIWNFILAKKNPNDDQDDDDFEEQPVLGKVFEKVSRWGLTNYKYAWKHRESNRYTEQSLQTC